MTRYILFTILAFTLITTAKAQKSDTLKGLEADTLVFITVEHEPEFPGGVKGFNKFLYKNLKWPDKTGTIDVQGKVFIMFVVEKDGTLSNIHVIRGLYPEFDTEAIRVMRLSPKWKPGTQNGHVVRVYYNMPIPFKLTEK